MAGVLPRRDGHSSGTPVAGRLEQPTRATRPTDEAPPAPEGASASLLFGLAPGGACRAADVAARAVRSCRTLSPLPWRRTLRPDGWAVCFLWRFPWGRPRRTLSGAASVWSPDFPPLRSGGRPADWRNRHMGAGARRSRRKERSALALGPLGEARAAFIAP